MADTPTNAAEEELDEHGLDKRGLPPIHRIKIPEGATIMSTKIRWLRAVGYEVVEIHKFLGVRYQQVRNVLTTQPKRAAREDLPALVVEVIPLTEDNLELMDQHAMEMNMGAQRLQHREERRATNRARRAERQPQLSEDDEGNEALDDENYGEQ
jgi:hypothetical protein